VSVDEIPLVIVLARLDKGILNPPFIFIQYVFMISGAVIIIIIIIIESNFFIAQ